jgi:hypothetical protein
MSHHPFTVESGIRELLKLHAAASFGVSRTATTVHGTHLATLAHTSSTTVRGAYP